jgi:dihydroorotate dehydrogenase electron transfer subunit
VSAAPFARRLLSVTGMQRLGAYNVLAVADPDGPLGGPGGDGEQSLVPGQFAMLAAAERWGGGEDERPYLPRAFSIARQLDGECHFLLDHVGPGTRRLCELRAGERLWALGPLGRGFRLGGRDLDSRRAILVGGGAGIAPLAILQDRLADEATPGGAANGEATVLLGFRDRDHAQGAALLSGASVATDDGSTGHHGLVTELLEADLARDPQAVVYACGPAGMLEGVRALCERTGVPAQLALEAGMACGFGACYGCVVPRRGGGYLRVCLDGPVIDAAELDHVDAHAGSPA